MAEVTARDRTFDIPRTHRGSAIAPAAGSVLVSSAPLQGGLYDVDGWLALAGLTVAGKQLSLQALDWSGVVLLEAACAAPGQLQVQWRQLGLPPASTVRVVNSGILAAVGEQYSGSFVIRPVWSGFALPEEE